jgi:tRNA threonylcarbamoyladenosine modification (KEOPS) complex  Pcc1 subunit
VDWESSLEPPYENVMERSIARFTRSGGVPPVARLGSAAWLQGYGTALSATARSRLGHMTLNLKSYKARIKVTATSKRVAAGICHALAPDLRLMPSTGYKAEISLKNSEVIFSIETRDIASLRASINSYLRLANASYKCLTL